MTREGPPWLADLQRRFGEALRTPLDRSTGTLAAATGSYGSDAIADLSGAGESAAARLAVYNRQYWFRLFDVMQDAFPLTARLLGYWTFNDYAARFLVAAPPRGWDVDDATKGFDAFLERALEGDERAERQALVEAARIDAAYRDVFAAPAIPPFRPSADDAAHLLAAHLLVSPAVEIVEEHSPLLELRRRILRESSGRLIALPPELGSPQWWMLARRDGEIAQIPLEPREAELLMLLRTHDVRDALATLEQRCEAEEREALPERARRWLAESVKREFWMGISPRRLQ